MPEMGAMAGTEDIRADKVATVEMVATAVTEDTVVLVEMAGMVALAVEMVAMAAIQSKTIPDIAP